MSIRAPLWGWVLVDKPMGVTSRHVTNVVQRLTGEKGVGHGGTLDPLATGLLPIAIGAATRLIPYLMHQSKTYTFSVRWGWGTDTDDSLGNINTPLGVCPSVKNLVNALPWLRGTIMQQPPLYCARKVAGVRAYDQARKGALVALAPRAVRIHRLDLLAHDPLGGYSHFVMRCSSGTYVRAVARDLARMLHTYGHVSQLRRVHVGPFTQGVPLEMLRPSTIAQHIQPPHASLRAWPMCVLNASQRQAMAWGQVVPIGSSRVACCAEALVACYGEACAPLFSTKSAQSHGVSTIVDSASWRCVRSDVGETPLSSVPHGSSQRDAAPCVPSRLSPEDHNEFSAMRPTIHGTLSPSAARPEDTSFNPPSNASDALHKASFTTLLAVARYTQGCLYPVTNFPSLYSP